MRRALLIAAIALWPSLASAQFNGGGGISNSGGVQVNGGTAGNAAYYSNAGTIAPNSGITFSGTTPTITAPVLSGTATGTYTLGGTPTISGATLSGTTTLPGSGGIDSSGNVTAKSLALNGASIGTDALALTGTMTVSAGIRSNNTGFTTTGSGSSTLFGDSLTGDATTTFTIKGTNVSASSTAAQNIAVTAPNATGTGGTSNGGSIVLTPGTSTSGTGGFVRLANTTTGTNADFLCLDSSGDILLQTSACTISSIRFKRDVTALNTGGLSLIAKLHPVSFRMKDGPMPNPDPNYDKPQIGLTAENVAAVDPRMAIYENDGVTPKSYRQEAVIAALVAAVNELQTCRLRVFGRCWF